MANNYEDEIEATGLIGFFKKIKSWYRLKRLFFKGKVRVLWQSIKKSLK